MKRHKIAKTGAEVFREHPDEGERPPFVPVRVGGKILKVRGDGPLRRGGPMRHLTDDEYCGGSRKAAPSAAT